MTLQEILKAKGYNVFLGGNIGIPLFTKIESIKKNDETLEHSKELFRGKKVLLVEDNELNREIATDILKELGIEITEAEDGTFAVDIIDKMYKKGIKEDYFDFIVPAEKLFECH